MKKWLCRVLIGISCLSSGALIAAPTLVSPETAYSIEISSPKDQDTFQNDTQSLGVTVTVTPNLDKDDTVALLVDGQAMGDPSHSTGFTVPWLERGSHTLQAQLLDQNGQQKAESSTITIYQQRHSKFLPAE